MAPAPAPASGRLASQLSRNRAAIAGCLALNAVLAVLAFACYRRGNVSVYDLYRDPNTVAQQHFLTGALSNAGAVMWFAAASVCVFACCQLLQPRRPGSARATGTPYDPAAPAAGLVLSAGLLAAMMGVDDLFMVHDGLAPRLSVPESAFYLAYCALIAIWLLTFRRAIARSDWLLLLLAGAGLGGSVLLDLDEVIGIRGPETLAEEMLKLFGITFWLAYCVRLAWSAVVPRTAA